MILGKYLRNHEENIIVKRKDTFCVYNIFWQIVTRFTFLLLFFFSWKKYTNPCIVNLNGIHGSFTVNFLYLNIVFKHGNHFIIDRAQRYIRRETSSYRLSDNATLVFQVVIIKIKLKLYNLSLITLIVSQRVLVKAETDYNMVLSILILVILVILKKKHFFGSCNNCSISLYHVLWKHITWFERIYRTLVINIRLKNWILCKSYIILIILKTTVMHNL